MIRPGHWTGRKCLAIGMIIGLVVALSVALAWPERKSWPARLVIPGPALGKGMAWGYSPDGRSFRTSSAAGLTSWDAATGRRGTTVPSPFIWRNKLSSDGRRFVGWVGDHYGAAEVVEGDALTETIERRFPVQGVQGSELAFRDDGRSVEAILADRRQRVAVATWDLASGAESRRAIRGPEANYTRPVACSPDGRVWAYLDKVRDGILLWDPRTDRAIGGLLRTPTTQRNLAAWAWTGAMFTPDGRTLITSRSDGQVEFWDIATGRLNKLVRLHPVSCTAMNMHLSPDGRTLVSSGYVLFSSSPLFQIWDGLRYLISGSGQNPTQASQETVVLDLTTDQILARARRCHAVAISPDGRTIVTQDLGGTISFRDIPSPSGR